jgi:uncharacterized membrane protein (GlpM family)
MLNFLVDGKSIFMIPFLVFEMFSLFTVTAFTVYVGNSLYYIQEISSVNQLFVAIITYWGVITIVHEVNVEYYSRCCWKLC